LIYQILLAAGLQAGMISTVSAVIGEKILDTGFHVTTPEAPDIQNYLAQMVQAGLTHVVLETTSHGIAQHRVTACEYDLAVLTNITHEHLDYHGTYEAYRDAKARLFTSLARTLDKPHGNYRIAVLNRDDASYGGLAKLVDRQYSYGFDPKADVRASQVILKPEGMNFQVAGLGGEQTVSTRLVGEYNVSNCLAALTATCVGLGIGIESALQGIAALGGIPGRMERIELGQEFAAIVDFAHTPNALRVALQAARQMAGEGGKVMAVFGSAGLRDRQKRRLMAQASVEAADLTILTAEDPRTESLEDILEEMAAGARSSKGVEGHNFWRIPDRGDAIRFAISKARPGDVVIILGKGHEQSMCFGEVEYAWDDRVALRAALSEFLGIPGPPMPSLPTSKQ
jgi:UDP-N-acetylmuramoyl-L-alanyl-D-glutamate--2,6-diaminopimelate ligase